MYFKSLLLLFILSQIEAERRSWSRRMDALGGCPIPNINHGRIRRMQRGNLVRFACYLGYELAGNKYATCRNSEWDVPIPVCVQGGCPQPLIKNGIAFTRHHGAWMEFFCRSDYELVGSAAIFCDGHKWNDTIPTCVETKKPPALSCDFEDADICGWKQDELHDFDWKRLNGRTPSSFLNTGPKIDHTFENNGSVSGYYMYIESTSRLENDTARLISPIYDGELAKNGCFSFYYHMFGLTTGGLKIYQKPEQVTMEVILALPDAMKQKYILFEKWGNQGDFWYRGVSQLNSSMDDFQIIIEGVRGASFTSDIAIDDVAILQGENCTIAQANVSTPTIIMPDSCSGRCDITGVPVRELGCGCTAVCISDGNCCPDFFEVCIFADNSTADESSTDLPRTEKLVAPSTTTAPIPLETTTSTTTTVTAPKETTIKSTTSRPTTSRDTTKIATTRTSTTIMTTKMSTKNANNTTTKASTTKIPTIVFKTTTKIYNRTGILQNSTTKAYKPVIKRWTTKKIEATTAVPVKTTYKVVDDRLKAQKEQSMQSKPIVKEEKRSSGLKTALITSVALLCIAAGAVWLVMSARTVRGRIALARLRGHTTRDAEVRYLNADVDDD